MLDSFFLGGQKEKKATESFNLATSNIYLTYKVLATSIPWQLIEFIFFQISHGVRPWYGWIWGHWILASVMAVNNGSSSLTNVKHRMFEADNQQPPKMASSKHQGCKYPSSVQIARTTTMCSLFKASSYLW